MRQLTRQDARRIAVRAQLLAEPRPTDLLQTVRHLTMLQDDPTAAVAPNAGLVAWSRLGSTCPANAVADAVEEQSLVDLNGLLRPAEDLALYRSEMAEWPGTGEVPNYVEAQAAWVDANDGFRRDLLEELRRDGPLTLRELPDTCDLPWRSSGWNNNRNVRMMLDLLVKSGELAAAGRRGRDRLWDLAERIYPDIPSVSTGEALHIRNQRRLAALGIVRAHGAATPGERNDLDDVGEAAMVEGVKGHWRIDPTYLEGKFHGRTAILSPHDQLVYDRVRMLQVFEFDYQLEMYKPAAARKWGYWAMPILSGDRLVGKVDATTDRKQGVLRVDAIHEDEPFSAKLTAEVRRELTDLAQWLDVQLLLAG